MLLNEILTYDSYGVGLEMLQRYFSKNSKISLCKITNSKILKNSARLHLETLFRYKSAFSKIKFTISFKRNKWCLDWEVVDLAAFEIMPKELKDIFSDDFYFFENASELIKFLEKVLIYVAQ